MKNKLPELDIVISEESETRVLSGHILVQRLRPDGKMRYFAVIKPEDIRKTDIVEFINPEDRENV